MGVDVSILMPVYNEVLHLEEALQSISEQGEKLSIEVVCVDDFFYGWDVAVDGAAAE